MAEDAFALSPINARATLPSEADYEAIASAFMETARGRWFLGEYAKRNRNADTRLVLDAVERIEATLAQQKATSEPSFADALPALIEAVEDARRKVFAALPTTDAESGIEPILKAASVLRDMAWGLRESGADTRLCDLIEAEARIIIDGCSGIYAEQAGSTDATAEAVGALDSLAAQVASLGQPNKASSFVAEPDALTPEAEPELPPEQANAAQDSAADATFEIVDTGETFQAPHPGPQVIEALAQVIQTETVTAPADTAASGNLWDDLEIIDTGPDHTPAETVALKPAPTVAEPKVAGPAVEDAQAVAPAPPAPEPAPHPVRPILDDIAVAATRAAPPPVAPEVAERAEAAAPTSLGQAALESGALPAMADRRTDPLAPIRRLSQAEKIALFS
jgi:hypothetical protein